MYLKNIMTLGLIISLSTAFAVQADSSFKINNDLEACIKKESMKVTQAKNENISLANYKGYLNKNIQVCLKKIREKYPKELAVALNKKRSIEAEIIKKKKETSEYKFFEMVMRGYRSKNCKDEVKRYYPKKLFFHSKQKINKNWSDAICVKYSNFIKHKKSP